MKKPKSSNPNNPDCSTAVQMTLDMLQCISYDPDDPDAADAIHAANTLLQYMDLHNDVRDKMSRLMRSHEYPNKSITFSRMNQCGQYVSHISITAMAVLYAMIDIMPTNNQVMLTLQDVMDYVSSIGNRTTARKAVDELLAAGCIAVARKGGTQMGTVYMINPLIATVGTEKPYLQYLFWQYTGDTTDSDGNTVHSAAHNRWIDINRDCTYAVANCRLKESQCRNMIRDANGNVQAVYNQFAPPQKKEELSGSADSPCN